VSGSESSSAKEVTEAAKRVRMFQGSSGIPSRGGGAGRTGEQAWNFFLEFCENDLDIRSLSPVQC
jgi:hypothetical protein